MFSMTKEESRDLDKFLLYSLAREGIILSCDDMYNDPFSHKDIDYCVSLYYKIDQYDSGLFFPISGSSDEEFWASPQARGLLAQGGFTKIFDEKYAEVAQQNEIKELELEKLKYEIKNAKRIFKTYWLTFGIAIAGFLLAIASFIFR
mgnify:FL=1